MSLQSPPGYLVRWVHWVRAHRRIVIAGWLAAVLIAMAAAHSAGTRYANNLSLLSQHNGDVLSLLVEIPMPDAA